MNSSKDDQNENETGHLLENNLRIDERTPHNDVIRHGDIVQGFQAPKRVEQIPKWYRNPRRILITIGLLIFVGVLIYQVIDFFISATT